MHFVRIVTRPSGKRMANTGAEGKRDTTAFASSHP